MSFKPFVLGAALFSLAGLGLAGCVSAPYSPDTGYSQGYPPSYYAAPTYYYYQQPVAVAPTPVTICTDTPAGC